MKSIRALIDNVTKLGQQKFQYLVTSNSIAANSSGGEASPTASDSQTLTIDPDSWFLCNGMVGLGSVDNATAYYPSSYSVLIRDNGTGRNLSNLRISQRVFGGNIFGSVMERRPILFAPSTELIFDIANLASGGANTVQIALNGYKIKKPTQEMIADHSSELTIPFYYLVRSASAIAANGATTLNLTTSTDSWFELHTLFGYGSVEAATDLYPNNFSVQVLNASTGERYSNIKIPQRLITSNAFNPNVERNPTLIPPGSILNFEVTNLSGSQNTVQFVLKGYKHFVKK